MARTFTYLHRTGQHHVRKVFLFSILTLISFAAASEAAQISVNCPNTDATTDREFTLTTDPVGATCFGYGDDANELNANHVHDLIMNAGWTLIDKDGPSSNSDNNFFVDGLGAISGSFTLDASLWSTFDRILIGFVVGGGQIDPKWAVFELPEGETSGLWANAPRQGGGLSHANLYGRTVTGDPTCLNPAGCDQDLTEVPEPASLLLVSAGLAVAGKIRNRRKKSA
jgi:hypothetical protein